MWRATLDRGARLVDFDGRYVVMRPGSTSDPGRSGNVIYDTWGIHEPVEVVGGVALIRQSLAVATGITLRADGLGVAAFGEPAGEVLDTMTSLLGAPDTEDFVDPFAEQVAMPYGYAANRDFRIASWESPGLYTVFSDHSYFRDDEEPHFVGWGVWRPGLQTEVGIGVGATVAEVLDAYGDTVALPDFADPGCDQLWAFRIGTPTSPDSSDHTHSMHGELDGDPSDPSTEVTSLWGGAMSSC